MEETEAVAAIELESDGDSDSGAYFLEPTSCTTSIADRIAEANKKLFDDSSPGRVDDSVDPASPRVKFCESLVDFAPEHVEYTSEEADSATNISEEELTPKLDQPAEEDVQEEVETHGTEFEVTETLTDVENENVESKDEENSNSSKLLLILLPREQSSSCESVMGNDDASSQDENEENLIPKVEEKIEVHEQKIRPKSAHKKHSKSEKVQCKLSPVSPELNCSVENDSKAWHESQKRRQKGKIVEKSTFCKEKTMVEPRDANLPVVAKTAPSKRSCCIVRSDLPKYDGLRSEYGLTAHQLQERKVKSAECRQKRRLAKQTKNLEESQKRQENQERFGVWLEEKTSKSSSHSSVAKKRDTLVRSDVFIQKNAVYASKCGVSYAVNYTLKNSKRKSKSAPSGHQVSFSSYSVEGSKKTTEIRKKTVNLAKLFENISPHAQKTYEIYLGAKAQD